MQGRRNVAGRGGAEMEETGISSQNGHYSCKMQKQFLLKFTLNYHSNIHKYSAFPPVLRDWIIKGLGMSNLVYLTGHIKDPVPLIEKRTWGLSPGVIMRFILLCCILFYSYFRVIMWD